MEMEIRSWNAVVINAHVELWEKQMTAVNWINK